MSLKILSKKNKKICMEILQFVKDKGGASEDEIIEEFERRFEDEEQKQANEALRKRGIKI